MPPLAIAAGALLLDVALPASITGLAVAGTTIGTLLVGTAVSEGIQFVADSLQGSPSGVQVNVVTDPTASRRLLLGKVYTAGSSMGDPIIHDHLPLGGGDSGANRVAEILIALADHECDGFEAIYVNGDLVDLDPEDATLGYPVTKAIDPNTGLESSNYKNKLWVKFHSGADGQAADAWLQDVPGISWTAANVAQNVCYMRCTCVYNSGLFSGFPTFNFVVRGAKLYDPSQDSTVPGGSGSQRWNTPSTYVWSDNPAVQGYNLARGISVGGKRFYGMFASSDEVPLDATLAAISICNETVTNKDSSANARYRCGCEVPVSQDVRTTMKGVVAAMAGTISTGGKVLFYAGAAQTPIFSFTDSDLIQGSPQTYDPVDGIDTLKNSVTGTYLDPAMQWTMVSAPTRFSNDDIAEDGGNTLVDSYKFDQIQNGPQCQRVMEQIRQRARAQSGATLSFGPAALNARNGQWIQGTSRLWSGTKTFEIRGRSIATNLTVTMLLREVPSDLATWDPASDELTIFGTSLPSADPPSALTPTGFVATPLSKLGANGAITPVVQVSWDDPQDATATGALVEFRLVGSTVSGYMTADVAAGIAELDQQLLPGANYEARLIFQALAGRPVAWTDWTSFITTPTVILSAGIDPISSLLMKALSPSATVRAAVADQIWFPWLDTMEPAFASTASAIADLMTVQGTLRDAGITRDPATGQVVISAIDAVNTDLQSYKTTVSATFDAVNASIALNVTQVAFNQGIAAVAAGFDPAYRWEFNTSVDGWTASTATISATASTLTYTGTGASPYLQSPPLALNAAANPLVQVRLTQSAGTAWGMTVQWGSTYQYSQAITEPATPAAPNVVQADMTGNANWTGTITGLRIALGDGTTTYLIDYIAIGASPIQAIVIGDLTGSVESLSSNVSLLAGQVSTLATASSVTALSGELSVAQSDIDANTASIALKAAQADLNSTNTTLTTVQQTLSAQAGQIEQVLAYASGQSAVGVAASPEQLGSNIASALAGFITGLAQMSAKVEYARQGLYADIGNESAARLQAVLELQAQSQTNQASILQVATALADALSADASISVQGTAIVLNPGSGFGGQTIAAAFTSEQEARAAADAANATSISTLAAYFGPGIDGSNTVSASIASEASTRASADAANASATSTLTTTVAGHTTSISTLTTSVNGLSAQWGVQINSNGAVTGLIRLDSGSSHSSFTVVANDFNYYDPTNGATPLFTITGGIAYFSAPLVAGLINASDIIANNVIVTGHFQANAVSQSFTALPISTVPTSEGGILNTSGGTVTVPGVTTQSKIDIEFMGSFTRQGGHSPTVTLKLYRGVNTSGTLLATSTSGGSGVAQCQPFLIAAVDGGFNGDGIYFLTASSDDQTCTINNGLFKAIHQKNG